MLVLVRRWDVEGGINGGEGGSGMWRLKGQRNKEKRKCSNELQNK